jgi:hypothetical protein
MRVTIEHYVRQFNTENYYYMQLMEATAFAIGLHIVTGDM